MTRNKRSKYDFAGLTIEEAGRGARVCISTSKRLLGASRLLKKSGYLELATFFVCTAIEEAGKALLLLDFQEETFSSVPDAVDQLSHAFHKHQDKLQDAFAASVWDEHLLKALIGMQVHDQSEEGVAKSLLEIADNLELPDVRPQVAETFQRRNEMLYTDFKAGRFSPPKDAAQESIFTDLLNTAGKVVARASLESAMAMICFRRGASRTQMAAILRDQLPGLIKEFRNQLKKFEEQYLSGFRGNG
jgi:AbiV family abortive infection protein